jgi:methionyl-tRNA formyltransferase
VANRSNFSAMATLKPLRIGFFGLPLAALLLERDGAWLEWAVLSPIAAPGRRRLRRSMPDARLLDLLLADAAWQTEVERSILAHPVDLIVSWFFTRRILGSWIDAAPLGAIGVHPSLLPRHRGPDPFYAVIDAGEATTGVTVHRLTAEYDRGPILAQRSLEVGDRNAWQLARALDRPSLALLRDVVRAYAKGSPPQATKQEENRVTWAPEPEGDALRVDWNWPNERVLRRIRALSPIPGLGLELGGRRFLVLAAQPTDDYPRVLEPGEAHIGHQLVLRTGNGAIAVEKACIGLEDEEPIVLGRARLADFLRGKEKTTSGGDF